MSSASDEVPPWSQYALKLVRKSKSNSRDCRTTFNAYCDQAFSSEMCKPGYASLGANLHAHREQLGVQSHAQGLLHTNSGGAQDRTVNPLGTLHV